MEKLIKRIVNITTLTLAVIATLSGLYVATKGADAAKTSVNLDISFYITYIMLFVILAMLAFFVVSQVFASKKTMIRTLILLAFCAVITLFSYLVSSEVLSDTAMKLDISVNIYRWAGTALNISYIALTGVILAFLGTFIYTKIKK